MLYKFSDYCVVKYYGMEMNVRKSKVMRISRQTFPEAPSKDYERSKRTGERRLLQLFG